MSRNRWIAALLLPGLFAGCNLPSGTPKTGEGLGREGNLRGGFPSQTLRPSSAPAGTPAGTPSSAAPSVAPSASVPPTTIATDNKRLTGLVRGPATLIGNNGANIIGNNGGGIIGNNGAGYRVTAVPTQQPYAGATVRLLDASGAPIRDAATNAPVVAIADAGGQYALPLPDTVALLAVALPDGKGELRALVLPGAAPAPVGVDYVSTLTTTYILEKFVKSQATPPATTLTRLPREVEAETRAKAEAALAKDTGETLAKVETAAVLATVDRLRQADTTFDGQVETVRKLLVIGSLSAAATDGPALSAYLAGTRGLALDATGNVVFADGLNRLVRVLSTTGEIGTLAGSGARGKADGVGAAASFGDLAGTVVAPDGTVYVADAENRVVRRITPEKVVSTLGGAAGWKRPVAVALDSEGKVYVLDSDLRRIDRLGADGAASAWCDLAGSGLNYAYGLLLDGAGGAYVSGDNGVVRVAPATTAKWLAGPGSGFADGPGASAKFKGVRAMARDSEGALIVVDAGNGKLRRIQPDGTVSTLSLTRDGKPMGGLYAPWGLVRNASGELFVGTWDYLLKVDSENRVTIAAGRAGGRILDGPSDKALFNAPSGMAIAPDGTVYVADAYNNAIRKLTPQGQVSTLAGGLITTLGGATIDGQGTKAAFANPKDVALGPDGLLYVSEFGGYTLRRVTPDGTVTTWIPKNGVFKGPRALVFDASGNLYVADMINNRIAKVTPDKQVSTFCDLGFAVAGLAVDRDGSFVACSPITNKVVRISASGVVTPLAGSGEKGTADGAGVAASFSNPESLALDRRGNAYVVDYTSNRVRKITPEGVVTTLEIDRPDEVAPLLNPRGVAVSADNLLYISDTGNNRIRAIPLD